MLAGRVAWVTGATGGLGPEIARVLAEAGAVVVASARREAELSELQTQLGLGSDRWLAAPADLTDPAAAQAVVEAAVRQFGAVDILAAVAGGWRGGKTFAETEPADLDFLLRINLLTTSNACRAVLPSMIARGWGRIVTAAARAAAAGQAKSAAYAASKAGVVALTQSIAAETRQSGITANTLLLGTIDTAANRAAMPAADSSRWVSPQEIASVVRFLCTEAASGVTGAAIPVFGRG